MKKKLVLCLVSIGLALSMLIPGLVAAPVEAADVSTSWAILIAGGYNTANNNARYWNDIGEMYGILTNTYGYTADHIFVLYANGNPPTAANCRDPQDAYGYPANIIDFAATTNNLNTVTNRIAASGSASDTLFVFTTDHGAEDGSLYLWGQTISPATFAGSGYIGKITKYVWRAFEMEECYSGAFVPALGGPRTFIATACSANEQSHGGIAHPWYDEFCFYLNAALKGAEPDFVGGTPVNADANNDGKASFVEAFNYAQSHDQASTEHPQYDDNGDGISHEGQMPVGGDGSLGSCVFLGIIDSGVQGQVRTATGAPLAYSTVTVKNSLLQVVQEVQTGNDGRYAIGLSPGIYIVWASHSGYYDLGQPVGVYAGVYTTLNFQLTQGTGGGCPFLYVWNGNDYVDEGLLDIHNAEGVDVTYEHVLITVPARVNGAYEFRLIEHPKTISHIDQVQLHAVLEDGTIEDLHLMSAQHSEYGNVLNLLLKSDDLRVQEIGADHNGGTSQSIDLKFTAVRPNAKAVAFVFTIEGYNMICKVCD